MSAKVMLAIIMQWGDLIQNIENPTEEMCIQSVTQSGDNLRYIKEEYQTYTVCLNAVKQNGKAIGLIKNKKLIDRQLAYVACSNNGEAIFDVPKELITEDLFMMAIKNMSRVSSYPKNIITGFYRENFYFKEQSSKQESPKKDVPNRKKRPVPPPLEKDIILNPEFIPYPPRTPSTPVMPISGGRN